MKFAGIIAASAALMVCCSKEASYDDVATDPSTQQPADDQGDTNPSIVSGEVLDSFGAKFENDKFENDENTKVSILIDEANAEATLNFEDGDAVLVVSGATSAAYQYDGTKFVPIVDPVTLDTDVTVYYPASAFALSGSDVVFTMPAAVADLADLGAKNPLAAQLSGDDTNGYTATFKAVGSVLQVNVTGALAISNVKLQNAGSSRMPLGPDAHFTIGWSAGEPTMTANESATNSEMNVSRSVTLSDTPQTFYYIVPAGVAYTDVSVLAQFSSATIGGLSTFTVSRGNWTADRNKVYTMSFYAGLFSGGDGTQADPYKIANARDFKNIATYCANGYGYDPTAMISAADFLDAYYQQTADINLNNATLTPIGSESAPFTGVYNGQKLSNFATTNGNNSGLFGYAQNATIKDITVDGATVSGTANVGAIVGVLAGGTVEGCTNKSAVTATGAENVGGIIGYISEKASISDCHNTGNIGGKKCVGGIVGRMDAGKVENSENRGNVTTTTDTEAGGIAGRFMGGTIKACYSSSGALITGYSRVGGIAGYQSNQGSGASLIINCAAKSNVKSTNSGNNGAAGGLVGYMYSAADAGDVVLTNCVALGSGVYNTWSKNAYLGAIVGQVNGAASLCYVRNCYSQHNSTSNTAAAVYYSSNGSSITNTKQTYMGGIYGYLQKGTVQNCYCVGTETAGISSKAYAGAGTKASDAAAGNTRMVVNNIKNGIQAVNVSSWTFYPSGIKDASATSAYLVDIMNLGTWETTINGARFSYTSSEGTAETVCEWVGQNGDDHSDYNPAFPSEILALNFEL